MNIIFSSSTKTAISVHNFSALCFLNELRFRRTMMTTTTLIKICTTAPNLYLFGHQHSAKVNKFHSFWSVDWLGGGAWLDERWLGVSGRLVVGRRSSLYLAFCSTSVGPHRLLAGRTSPSWINDKAVDMTVVHVQHEYYTHSTASRLLHLHHVIASRRCAL